MSRALERRLSLGVVALLALAGTFTTIGHDFTYDDRGVILDNPRVHLLDHIPRLFAETYWPPKYGADGYRPLVMSLFTMQWVAGNGAPWVFHLVNILLAISVAVAVYAMASTVLSNVGATVAGALFAIHPVHVEVTGNIVGQSELIVALLLTLATGVYVRQRLAGALRPREACSIALLFALALLAKEHAIVLPGILAASEFTVIPRESWKRKVAATRLVFLLLLLVASLYLYVRGFAHGDLAGFIPYPIFRFLHMSAFDRIGTMMNEIPRIAQLLSFPTHLSADYSPNDVIIANGFGLSELPGIFITLGCVLLAIVLRSRAPVSSFGLLWTMISFLPVSNLIIPAGFVTAERTLFFPSIGVVLIAGDAADRIRAGASRPRQWAAGVLLVLLIMAGTARTVDRQRIWKNNDDFFVALMKDAPNGYRAHYLFAHYVGLKSRLSQMELEYRRAVRMFPYDAGMTLTIADAYTRVGLCQPAVALFDWTFQVDPTVAEGRYQYVYCLAQLGRWSEARNEAIIALPIAHPRDIRLLRLALRRASSELALAKPAGPNVPQSAPNAAKSTTQHRSSLQMKLP